MKKCPDCKKEVGYGQVYCPHCSAELFKGRRHDATQSPSAWDASPFFMKK